MVPPTPQLPVSLRLHDVSPRPLADSSTAARLLRSLCLDLVSALKTRDRVRMIHKTIKASDPPPTILVLWHPNELAAALDSEPTCPVPAVAPSPSALGDDACNTLAYNGGYASFRVTPDATFRFTSNKDQCCELCEDDLDCVAWSRIAGKLHNGVSRLTGIDWIHSENTAKDTTIAFVESRLSISIGRIQ